MSAAQTISDKKYTWHHTKEECEVALACGYPYGFGVNLTVFTGVPRRTPLNTPWTTGSTPPAI